MARVDDTDLRARYLALELSPEQKAQARERLEADVRRARDEGFYERLRALRGKVRFTVPLEDLRED